MGYAIGDALGVPFEFQSREEIHGENSIDMIGYGSHDMPEGTWSDDTSMVLATLDSINNNNELNYEDIMENFLNGCLEESIPQMEMYLIMVKQQ